MHPNFVKCAAQCNTVLVVSFGPLRHADVWNRAGRVTLLFIVLWFTTTSTCHKTCLWCSIYSIALFQDFSRLLFWFHPHLHGLALPSDISQLPPVYKERILVANHALEITAWVCHLAVHSANQKTFMFLMMPEDFGGHRVSGPASP